MTKAKSSSSLVATTAGSCMFFNLTASDQYLAIVVLEECTKVCIKKEN